MWMSTNKHIFSPLLKFCYGIPWLFAQITKFSNCMWNSLTIPWLFTKSHFPWCVAALLTLKHRETHGCVVSTAATDALVLKHQVISILNADQTFIVLDQFYIKNITLFWTTLENKITFWKNLGWGEVRWGEVRWVSEQSSEWAVEWVSNRVSERSSEWAIKWVNYYSTE